MLSFFPLVLEMKVIFKNLLRRIPTCDFVLLTDTTSHELSNIPNIWMKYYEGSFRFPSKRALAHKSLENLTREKVEPEDDWPECFIQTIFNECGL